MNKKDRKEKKPAGKITVTNTGDIPLWAKGDGDICVLLPGDATRFTIDQTDGAISVGRAYRGAATGAAGATDP